MKTRFRVIAVLLMVLTMFSAVAVPAFAANTSNEEFAGFEIFDGRALPPREKDDASPHYLYLYADNDEFDTYYVASLGLAEYGDDDFNDCTMVSGQYVDHVTCREGTRYSIYNGVYANGYPWATLFFSGYRDNYIYGGCISGRWSPDSSGRYTYATTE